MHGHRVVPPHSTVIAPGALSDYSTVDCGATHRVFAHTKVNCAGNRAASNGAQTQPGPRPRLTERVPVFLLTRFAGHVRSGRAVRNLVHRVEQRASEHDL